jgi:hypothetical protein
MQPNRIFFPQTVLDTWIADERVELTGDELLLKEEGRRYKIAEAVRVVTDVAGGGDAHQLLGKVKTRSQLEPLSAELLETSMVLGDDAYDVVPGFVGEPIGAFEADQKPQPAKGAPSVTNDEELLASFLLKSLDGL